MIETASNANFFHNSLGAIVQTLPDVPEPEKPEPEADHICEPYTVLSLQPFGLSDSRLGLTVQLAAPVRDHHYFRKAITAHARTNRMQREEAYAQFWIDHPAGQKLLRVRATKAEAARKLNEANAAAKIAETDVRVAISRGDDTSPAEERYRAARIEAELLSMRLDAAEQALEMAETDARSYLHEVMQAVRQQQINEEKERWDDAGAALAQAAGAIAVEYAEATANLQTSSQPIVDSLLRLPPD